MKAKILTAAICITSLCASAQIPSLILDNGTSVNDNGTYRWILSGDPSSSGVFKISQYDGSFHDFMTIGSTGNIGIGTTSPSTLLHVNTTTGGIRFQGLGSAGILTLDGSGYVGTTPLTSLGWTKGTGTVFVTQNSDKVGIGTNPQVKLHVDATGDGIRFEGLGSAGIVTIDGSGNLGTAESPWSTAGGLLYPTNIAHKVGIGTDAPQEMLQVNGNIRFGDGTSPSSGNFIEWFTSGSSGAEYGHKIYSYQNSGTAKLCIDGKHNSSTFSNILTISANGFVGLGVSSPSSRLHIDGVEVVDGNSYVNGLAYCTNGWWSGSDARFKKNIRTLDNPLSMVRNLRGMKYEFDDKSFPEKGFDNGSSIGFIAQELAEVVPEAVKKDKDGYYAVNYAMIIPLLVEAIKEQQGQIDLLKEQVAKGGAGVFDNKYTIPSVTTGKDDLPLLYQNEPNPFGVSAKVRFYLPANTGAASIIIYDLTGKQLTTYDISGQVGANSIQLSSDQLAPGRYFYSLIVGHQVIDTKNMVVIK